MSIDKLMSDDNFNIDKGLYLYVYKCKQIVYKCKQIV